MRSRLIAPTAACAILAASVAIAWGRTPDYREKPEMTRLAIDGRIYHIQVARTPEDRTKGLSGPLIQGRDGMLFLFPRPARPCFWMRDTRTDIEIAFLDENWRVFQVERLKAHDETSVCASRETDRVLELLAR